MQKHKCDTYGMQGNNQESVLLSYVKQAHVGVQTVLLVVLGMQLKKTRFKILVPGNSKTIRR